MKPKTTLPMPTDLTKSIERMNSELTYCLNLSKVKLQLEIMKMQKDIIQGFALMLIVDTVVIVALIKLL
jgi:hypothetical protein